MATIAENLQTIKDSTTAIKQVIINNGGNVDGGLTTYADSINDLLSIDLSLYDIYGNRQKQTTANCYVVKEAGLYKFPLVYGNAIKDGQVNASAYTKVTGTYSMDFVDYQGNVITQPYITGAVSVEVTMADTTNIIKDVRINNGYVLFSVDEVPTEGANAVISIKDSNGIIMWSWHIWVWPHNLTPVEITNNTGVKYNILPVNLATKLDTADSINKTTGWKNWYYQWGRPTPLLCPAAYNSTDNHASYGTLDYVSEAKAENFQTGIQNPNKFYKIGSSPYNWFGTTAYYNLWDANCTATGNSDNNVVKTVYDPCPVGFKMPNGNTFTYFSNTNVVGGFSNGWHFKRYAGDTAGVFFPASGYRSYADGSFVNVGNYGFGWLSSANSQDNAYYLMFYSSYANPQSSSRRAGGHSVRPVQE